MQFYKVTNNLLIDFTCRSTDMVYSYDDDVILWLNVYNANRLQRKNLAIFADYLSIAKVFQQKISFII